MKIRGSGYLLTSLLCSITWNNIHGSVRTKPNLGILLLESTQLLCALKILGIQTPFKNDVRTLRRKFSVNQKRLLIFR